MAVFSVAVTLRLVVPALFDSNCFMFVDHGTCSLSACRALLLAP